MGHEFPRSERTEEEKKAIANGELDENGQYNLIFDKEDKKTENKMEIRPSTEEEIEEDKKAQRAEDRRTYHQDPCKIEYLDKKEKRVAEMTEILINMKEKIRNIIGQEFYDMYHTNPQINVDNPGMKEIRSRVLKTKKQYPDYEPSNRILIFINAYYIVNKCMKELGADRIEELFQRFKNINSGINDSSIFIKGQSEWRDLMVKLNLKSDK